MPGATEAVIVAAQDTLPMFLTNTMKDGRTEGWEGRSADQNQSVYQSINLSPLLCVCVVVEIYGQHYDVSSFLLLLFFFSYTNQFVSRIQWCGGGKWSGKCDRERG